ncbi:MAG: hypothetical protein Q8934_18550 [Bacillota bacterium]|nr:hypothetical protein [Bacillota bacterium]
MGVFPEKYFNGIAIFYDTFNKLLPIPMVVLMALVGLLLLLSNFSSEQRSNVKTYFAGFIYLVLAMRFGTIFIKILFSINYFFVDLVYSILSSNGIHIGRFVDTIWGDKNGFDTITSQGGLGIALLVFCATFMTFLLNYQYAIRMIMLSIMILLFPVVIIGLIFPSKRQAFALWVSEVVSQIYVQTAHAIALGLFFYMRHYMQDISFWIIIAYFFGLPMIVGVVQKFMNSLWGIPSGGNSMMNGLNAMTGVAALMSAGRMVSSLRGKGGNSKLEDFKGNNDKGINDRLNLSDDTTPSLGKGSSIGKGTMPLSNGSKGSSFIGKMAKGATKMAGATTGAMLGAGLSTMATGNPMMGLAAGGMLGGNLGGRIGDGVSSLTTAPIDLIKDSRDLMKENEGMSFGEALKERVGFQDASQLFDPQQAGQIGQNLAGTPGKMIGQALARGNQAANFLSGGKYGQNSVSTLQNLDQLKQKRETALANYQNAQPMLNTAKLQKEQAQSKYGKGSSYHNGLAQRFEQAREHYDTQKLKLDSLNKEKSPMEYKTQSHIVNQAKNEMNTSLKDMNTPHPDLRSAVEHFSEIQSSYSGYQLEAQQITDSINQFYKDNTANANLDRMEELRTERKSRGEL